jgi:hypothetical protein
MSNNELDNWYKQHIEHISGPSYSDAYWNKAQLFIARAEKIRKLGIANHVLLMVLLIAFLGTYFLQPNLLESNPVTLSVADTYKNQINISKNVFKGSEVRESISESAEFVLTPSEIQTIDEQIIKNNLGSSTTSNRKKTRYEAESNSSENSVQNKLSVTDKLKIKSNQTNEDLNAIPISKELAASDILSVNIPIPKSSFDNALDFDEKVVSQSENLSSTMDLPSKGLDRLPAIERALLGTELILIEYTEIDHSFIKPIRTKKSRWSNGMVLSIPTGVTRQADNSTLLGLNVALLQTYEVYDGLKIGAGIGYANRRGALGVQKDNPNAIYDFELVDVGNRIALRELHQLTVPIQFSKRFGKTTIHLGYQFNYLVSAFGNLESYKNQYEFYETYMSQSTEVTSTSYGQVSSEGIKNFSHDMYLRMTYPISKHLSIGLGASYWISGYFESDFGVRMDRRTRNYFNAYSPNKAFDKGALNLELAMYYNL